MGLVFYTKFREILLENGAEKAGIIAKKKGFSDVEILESVNAGGDVIFKTVDSAKQAGELFAKTGVGVACHSVFANLFQSDETEEKLCHIADCAKALGSDYMLYTLYPPLYKTDDLPDFKTVFDDLAERASRVNEHAAKQGITLLLEPQGVYINGAEGLGSFYRLMKKRFGDSVAMCGDLGNSMFAGYKPTDFVREYVGDIKHVHIKDYKYSSDGGRYRVGNGYMTDCVPGEGDAGFYECVKILREAGYSGKWSVETDMPDAEYETAVKTLMDYFNKWIISY